MDLANSLKRGLGAVSVSVALSLCSAGVSAVELVPVSCNADSDVCGATFSSIASAPGGLGWDLLFENNQFLRPNSGFKLTVEFFGGATDPPFGDVELTEVILTTVDANGDSGEPIKGGSVDATDTSVFRGMQLPPPKDRIYIGTASFDSLPLPAPGSDIYDFHLRCDPNNTNVNCLFNVQDGWELVGYRFDASADGGSFALNGAPPVSSPGTLALMSLALIGVAVPAARRRRSSRAIASA